MRKTIIIALCTYVILQGKVMAQISKYDQQYTRYTNKKNTKENFVMINDSTMRLTRVSEDPEYGFSALKPVMLGLAYMPDSAAKYRVKYLNALTGPDNQDVYYERIGACCVFHTPNQPRYWLKSDPKQTEYGLLEHYRIWYEGSEPQSLFLNIYDEGELFAPFGFGIKAP